MTLCATPLTPDALDTLFLQARSHNGWLDGGVSDAALVQLYDIVKHGPTSANCSPMRIVFVRSAEAKARLLPALAPANVEKVRQAPVTAIVAYDTHFHALGETLFPHRPAMYDTFANDPALAQETAMRNSSMQGGYLILAARALGLDCGPLSGFDAEAVNRTFFADGPWRVNFLCNLGRGDPQRLFARLPRLPFGQACRIE
ncbi:malonic semialdehyde reductase [Cupriavidus numazuensis]|uniref:Putative NADH dehydrogenase/NAD(P)H nitroreductase LMG26411_06809 n=1 Tax=Cupriavidus numazuensis TaxID=221992 RepID=A0ABN7QEG1_9BURK|nr:malonic semialdehyde reductase [Cupriavidus numazuensis]CAG2159571.1 putative malonic semialdehyde reductase RutE [Cupriavidus numazuensis]